MSKVGRRPINITSATVSVSGSVVTLKGPKGTLTHELPQGVSVELNDKVLTVHLESPTSKNRSHWGLHRALLANKVIGVEQGFETKMKIVGLGYKAQVSGKKVSLTLGFSHKVDLELPDGVQMDVDKTGQNLTLSGIDKFILGNACDAIRSCKPPEPYKGTGIMYANEVIHRKAGKAKSS